MSRPHPVYGYDMDKVKETLCLHCSEPIRDEEYEEVRTLARFGTMMFIHKRCDTEVTPM